MSLEVNKAIVRKMVEAINTQNLASLDALMELMENMKKYATEAGVTVHGFYLNANEHTFYFILEGDNYAKISKFLGFSPVLTHYTAKITPVVTLEQTLTFARNVIKE